MKEKITVFLDNEGPCTLNDNAQENVAVLAEKVGLGKEIGEKFYRRLSVIDDIWGDFHLISQDSTYSSGHTVKVVLPFLKSMGATEAWLYEFAKQSLRIVPHIGEVINSLAQKYQVWKISTSYSFFIKAFCDQVGFDFSRARCTEVKDFDRVKISLAEQLKLMKFMEAAAKMPVIDYDCQTGKVIPEHEKYYKIITEFVWEQVHYMRVGAFLKQVHPIGQEQKCLEMKSLCREHKLTLNNVLYVGDSQTDRGCVGHLREFGGLSLMFNGKGPVCYESDLMYIGQDARAIEEVADIFAAEGREGTLAYFGNPQAVYGGTLVTVNGRSREEVEGLEKASIAMRKEFRGCAIGELT